MGDISLELTVLGLGLVMFLWGYDKVWAPTHPERAKELGRGLLVFGFAYVLIALYLIF
jgi:hypothetical protein